MKGFLSISRMPVAARAAIYGMAVLLATPVLAQSEMTPAPAEPAAGLQPTDDGVRGRDEVPMTDQDFVKAAAQSAMMEVALSQVAQERTRNLRVSVLAQRTLEDQQRIGTALKAAAGKQKVALPDKLDVDHQATVSTLKLKQDGQFDTTYATQIRNNRNRTKALFEQAKTSTTIATPLREFAESSLQILESSRQQLMSVQVSAAGAGQQAPRQQR
jgi:putative membrane protein